MQFIIIFAFCCLIMSTEARARDAQPLLNFFLNQIDREASRQQQLQFERQIQKQNDRDWGIFQSAWSDCFKRSDLARCDLALSFPNLGPQDRTHLLEQRQRIIDVQAENEARAERALGARAPRDRAPRGGRQRRREGHQVRRRRDRRVDGAPPGAPRP